MRILESGEQEGHPRDASRRETADSFRTSFALDGYQFATFFTIAMPVDRTAQQVDYQSALIDRD